MADDFIQQSKMALPSLFSSIFALIISAIILPLIARTGFGQNFGGPIFLLGLVLALFGLGAGILSVLDIIFRKKLGIISSLFGIASSIIAISLFAMLFFA